MLIEFSVENFKSIKDRITFSLVATKDDSLQSNLITAEELKGDSLLKSAVIYGANASGKTNVLASLVALRSLVISSHKYQKGEKIPFFPFRLDKEYTSKPTKYAVVFIKNKIKYVYELSFNSNQILEENLYYYPHDKRAIIFERDENDLSKKYDFTIEESLQKTISERTLSNMLYLSKATQENFDKVSDVFDWFKNNFITFGPRHEWLLDFDDSTFELIRKNSSIKSDVLNALLEADVGIEDLSTLIQKIPLNEFEGIPPELLSVLVKDKKEIERKQVRTVHKGVEFDLDEESEGTQKIFCLIGPWIDALKNGKLLIIDELDTKLHHTLVVFLIHLFHDLTQNMSDAQLIFTTHDINLLDQDLFRRDQIWFTEKKPDNGSTDLYSLVEFSPRKDKDLERGYLAGKYGALPFLKSGKIFNDD
jgi:AAA15 family ATPase/GTPase